MTGLDSAPAQAIRESVRTLNPGYFALVMGTGIVSVAMHNQHRYALSTALLVLAAVAYVVLIGLNLVRVLLFGGEVVADLTDPRRAFGYFTFVAGTEVLGTRLAIDHRYGLAFALLGVGATMWLLLGYLVPWAALLHHRRRPDSAPLASANGTWFIWVVASQSVATLAAVLEPVVHSGRRELALLAVVLWSVGVFLYAAAATSIALRMLLYPLHTEDLTPPYWVAMGATAITVVAGARIVQMADAPILTATRPLITGAAVVFWAFGTWLIPPLIAAGVWRHLIRRVPLRYEATLWSIEFPLGMYSVAGQALGDADHLPIVGCIGSAESWIALGAWGITFAAMLYHLARTLRADPTGRR